MASGVPYEEYTRIFHYGATPVESSSLTKNSGFFTVLLLLVGMYLKSYKGEIGSL